MQSRFPAMALLALALAACDSGQTGDAAKQAKQATREQSFKGVPIRGDNLGERWEKADANKDGKLSRDEALVGYTPGVGKNFEVMDANKDGFVTNEERAAFRKGQAASK